MCTNSNGSLKRIDDLQVMAHEIVMDGCSHKLSVARISADRKKVEIMPFRQEIHSTPFYNGVVIIEATPEGYYCFASRS